MTNFVKNNLFSVVPYENVMRAIQSLCDAGMLRQTTDYQVQFPFDGYEMSECGRTASSSICPASLTRNALYCNAFGQFETGAILAALGQTDKLRLFKRATPNLSINHRKQRYAVDAQSDPAAVENSFRSWSKSPLTTRQDQQPKEYKCQVKDRKSKPLKSTTKRTPPTNESFYACEMKTFDDMDSNMKDVVDVFKKEAIAIRSSVAYDNAPDLDEGRREVKIA